MAFGILIARGIAASIGTLISDVYGVAQQADELATSPTLLVLALVIGIVTSIVAAAIPAHQAARVDPVQALQKGKYQVLSAGESRLRAIAAVVLGAFQSRASPSPRLLEKPAADRVSCSTRATCSRLSSRCC